MRSEFIRLGLIYALKVIHQLITWYVIHNNMFTNNVLLFTGVFLNTLDIDNIGNGPVNLDITESMDGEKLIL